MMVALDTGAVADMEAFGRDMQDRQQQAGGLMRSAFGKPAAPRCGCHWGLSICGGADGRASTRRPPASRAEHSWPQRCSLPTT